MRTSMCVLQWVCCSVFQYAAPVCCSVLWKCRGTSISETCHTHVTHRERTSAASLSSRTTRSPRLLILVSRASNSFLTTFSSPAPPPLFLFYLLDLILCFYFIYIIFFFVFFMWFDLIWFAEPICFFNFAFGNESYNTHECSMSRTWMSAMNAFCRTYECVMSHVWMSQHITYE